MLVGEMVMSSLKKTLSAFAMPIVALLAALLTCFFVPIDSQYINYFDFRTLSCLFCTLAVVCAFKNIRFFRWLADVIVRRFKTVRGAVAALVFVTYFGSMIMANDMALITFLPLGYLVLESCAQRRYLAFVFVMQNVAANLGGMLTLFGNPQNIYLYSYYSFSAPEFFKVMAAPFAVAFVLIFLSCLFVRPIEIEAVSVRVPRPPLFRTVAYSALFAVSVLMVFRVFPYWWGLAAVVAALLLLDPACLLKVDYKLLLTFAAFFVFAGNLARIDAVKETLSAVVAFSPLLVGVASCQVMSNVPTAMLLSRFTSCKNALLIAVNIGGLGTPVASLASLITLGEFRAVGGGGVARYLGVFLTINFSFLAVLLAVALLILPVL